MTKFVGQSVARKEDSRLLTGRGRYTGDIKRPGMLDLAFLRSPVAHARILRVDTAAARAAPGVALVVTGADLQGDLAPVPGMQNRPPAAWRTQVPHAIDIPDQPILANEEVRHVGEAIAAVVADNRYLAEDALELIDYELEPLPAVTGIDAALADHAPPAHSGRPSNVVANFRVAKGGAAPPGLHTIRRTFTNHRILALPMECRAILAEYDPVMQTMTVWAATQVVHWLQRELCSRLDMPEARVRCVALDVGGGFGVKGHVYPEDILIPYLARELGRPVRWLEDRSENLINATHARDDRHEAEITFDGEGRIHAVHDRFVKDSGAYAPVGIGALSNSATHMLGPYHVENFSSEATLVVTNKTANAPYRGTGRPEAAFVMERLIDLAAHSLGLDPVEMRRRNMIGPQQMPYQVGIPYRDGAPVIYDSGDYPAAFERAIAELGGLQAIRAQQREAWDNGRYLGLGVAPYVEGTGAGPFEGATVRIDPSGALYVATGACSQGQGHETVFAQVAADEWGVTPDKINLAIADTAIIAQGYGTVASRSAVNSSAAIRRASFVLRQKVFALAAHMLECAEADLEVRDGRVSIQGVPQMGLSFRELAQAAKPGWDNRRPPGMSAGLEVTEYWEPPTVTWSYATHAGLVEVDRWTGEVRVRDYVVVHDAGTLINPRIADGQVLGAVAQGFGNALLEEVRYDADGQVLTGSLADYLAPVAATMPPVRIFHMQTPTPLNELGIKGLGEGGIAGPPVVVANGVCDALRPIGYEICETPIRPANIIAALARA